MCKYHATCYKSTEYVYLSFSFGVVNQTTASCTLNGNRQPAVNVNGNRQTAVNVNGNRQTAVNVNGNRQTAVNVFETVKPTGNVRSEFAIPKLQYVELMQNKGKQAQIHIVDLNENACLFDR